MSDRFLLRRDRVVQAGAGTGKTHALVTQYLHLCAGLTAHEGPLAPQKIGAMTFTDKAAGEMLLRLRHRTARLLQALAQGNADEAVGEAEPDLLATARALGRPIPPAAHWEKVLVQLGGAPVGTFHSFAGGLLRRHAALCGIDPDYVLLDEDTAREMEAEATERVVLGALEGALAGRPEAVSVEEAAQLVAEYGFKGAAGGSGAALVEYLCQVRRKRAEDGLGPAGLAAGYKMEVIEGEFLRVRKLFLFSLQMLARLATFLGEKSAESATGLGRLLTPLSHALGDLSGLGEALPLCAEVCAGLGRLRARPKDEASRQNLGHIKDQLRKGYADLLVLHHTRQASPLALTFERLLSASWEAYEEAKRRAAGLDFTDLLYRARDLLRDHAEVQARVRERFAVLLVDEFQDTNPLQGELLLLIAGAPGQRGGAPGRLYLVGDRKQSIYEFRGADVATFSRFCQEIVAAGGDEEMLTASRRSLPGVIHLSNTLFSQVMQPPAGTEPYAHANGWLLRWDPARDALTPLREADPARREPAAELLRREAPPDQPAQPKEDDPLGREAEMVAQRIVALQRGGRRYGDMAILLWRFTHLDRYLHALQRARIPHYVVKGRGFYDAQEIRDLSYALALVDDPDDTLALVSVLRSPLCGVSDDTLVRLHLAGRLRLHALLEEDPPLPAEVPADEAERLRRLLVLLSLLGQRGDRLGPSGCLRALCEATDLPAVLAAQPEGEQRVANLELLCARSHRFEEAGGDLRGFVRWLRVLCDPNLGGDALAPQAQIVDERDDVVRVMTVHQAKGLEFPVVFIPGCAARERGDFGAITYDRQVGLGITLRLHGERLHTLPSQTIQHLRGLRGEAESARLFYVAVTRARDQVIFAGEGRRATARSWRGLLDAFLATPQGWLLTPRDPAPPLLEGPPAVEPAQVPPDPRREEAQAQGAALALLRAYRLSRLPVPPGHTPLRLSLSAACDLAVCPRRFHLQALRLEEHLPAGEVPARAGASDEDRGEPLRHGTLAHRLLSRAVFAEGGADLPGLLAADGYDAGVPAVGEVRTRVTRFLHSRLVLELLEDRVRPRLFRRALPFLMRLPAVPVPGAAAWSRELPFEPGRLEIELRGQLDLLIIDPGDSGDPERPESVTLVDYHYSYAPPSAVDGALQAMRRGLLGGVLRALCPGAASIRVGFAYLREADPAPRLQESHPAEEQAARERLGGAALGALLESTQALRLPALPLASCTELRCGYRYRCHRHS